MSGALRAGIAVLAVVIACLGLLGMASFAADGFVLRIELGPSYFLGASLLALLVAWVTVSGHAYRVARGSAADALRYE